MGLVRARFFAISWVNLMSWRRRGRGSENAECRMGRSNSNCVERMGRGPQKLAAAIAETGTDRPGGRSLQRIGEVVTTTFIIPSLKVFEGS
jgi:hypothetical protein